jgi:hypothetical protein
MIDPDEIVAVLSVGEQQGAGAFVTIAAAVADAIAAHGADAALAAVMRVLGIYRAALTEVLLQSPAQGRA